MKSRKTAVAEVYASHSYYICTGFFRSDKFGSQFLITTGSDADVLDDSQVVFGEVGEGMEEALGIGFYFDF